MGYLKAQSLNHFEVNSQEDPNKQVEGGVIMVSDVVSI